MRAYRRAAPHRIKASPLCMRCNRYYPGYNGRQFCPIHGQPQDVKVCADTIPRGQRWTV